MCHASLTLLSSAGRTAAAASIRITPSVAMNASRSSMSADPAALLTPEPAKTGRPTTGRIERRDLLGGLIHEYHRAAA